MLDNRTNCQPVLFDQRKTARLAGGVRSHAAGGVRSHAAGVEVHARSGFEKAGVGLREGRGHLQTTAIHNGKCHAL